MIWSGQSLQNNYSRCWLGSCSTVPIDPQHTVLEFFPSPAHNSALVLYPFFYQSLVLFSSSSLFFQTRPNSLLDQNHNPLISSNTDWSTNHKLTLSTFGYQNRLNALNQCLLNSLQRFQQLSSFTLDQLTTLPQTVWLTLQHPLWLHSSTISLNIPLWLCFFSLLVHSHPLIIDSVLIHPCCTNSLSWSSHLAFANLMRKSLSTISLVEKALINLSFYFYCLSVYYLSLFDIVYFSLSVLSRSKINSHRGKFSCL
jgi:hypothetical protein